MRLLGPLRLQPLGRKDAATLAHALVTVFQNLLEKLAVAGSVRIVHVLVGDGVATNLAASRLVHALVP